MEFVIFVIALTTIVFATFSRRIENKPITPPMLFTTVGVLLALMAGEFIEQEHADKLLEVLAELTLVVVLFIDASRIGLPLLIKDYRIPLRMLGLGLPLTILLGTIIAKTLFVELTFWEAALLSAILAPTDAALGQAVVSSPDVPATVRQSLSVESGLNDGIVLPLVILCATLASMNDQNTVSSLMAYWGKQVTLGPLAGVAVGWIGSVMLGRARAAQWLSQSFQRVSGVALALLAWSLAILIGGNGFIAAFVAGLAVSCRVENVGDSMQEFGEAEGQWMTLATFLLFGALFVLPVFESLTLIVFVYAVLSLTVIRMLPVMLSLIGLGFQKPTYWFMGWFGPRGLASLLFALLVVSDFDLLHGQLIFTVSIVTVVFSIFAHGISAAPASRWYRSAIAARCSKESPELSPCLNVSTKHRVTRQQS